VSPVGPPEDRGAVPLETASVPFLTRPRFGPRLCQRTSPVETSARRSRVRGRWPMVPCDRQRTSVRRDGVPPVAPGRGPGRAARTGSPPGSRSRMDPSVRRRSRAYPFAIDRAEVVWTARPSTSNCAAVPPRPREAPPPSPWRDARCRRIRFDQTWSRWWSGGDRGRPAASPRSGPSRSAAAAWPRGPVGVPGRVVDLSHRRTTAWRLPRSGGRPTTTPRSPCGGAVVGGIDEADPVRPPGRAGSGRGQVHHPGIASLPKTAVRPLARATAAARRGHLDRGHDDLAASGGPPLEFLPVREIQSSAFRFRRGCENTSRPRWSGGAQGPVRLASRMAAPRSRSPRGSRARGCCRRRSRRPRSSAGAPCARRSARRARCRKAGFIPA